MRHVKQLRASGRIELKFLLAASFASVLVHLLGGLPFFVDLWGETEGGKTVSLMVAASVWANPDGNAYIGDFKTTDVALEAKADMLNHLPMFLDDTSKVSKKSGITLKELYMTCVLGRVRQGQIKNLESTGKTDGGTYLYRMGSGP